MNVEQIAHKDTAVLFIYSFPKPTLTLYPIMSPVLFSIQNGQYKEYTKEPFLSIVCIPKSRDIFVGLS